MLLGHNFVGKMLRIKLIWDVFHWLWQAFIIAFSSNFIPKMVYRYDKNENPHYGTLQGFLNYSLASFNTSDLDEDSRPDPAIVGDEDPGICR